MKMYIVSAEVHDLHIVWIAFFLSFLLWPFLGLAQNPPPPTPLEKVENSVDPAATDLAQSGPPPPMTLAEIQEIASRKQHQEVRSRMVKAILLSEVVYVGGVLVNVFGLLGYADPDFCWGFCGDLYVEKETDWREASNLLVERSFFPVTGAVTVLLATTVGTIVHNRSLTYRTLFSVEYLGSGLGYALDIGLMTLLYYKTESTAALLVPTMIGFLILPELGCAVGSRLSQRSIDWIRPAERKENTKQASVSLWAPMPTVFTARDDSLVPGAIWGGTF